MTPTAVAQNVVPLQQVVYLFLASTATLLAGGLWLIRSEATRIAREEVSTHEKTPHGDVDAVKRLSDQMGALEKAVHELAVSMARWEGSCTRRHALED